MNGEHIITDLKKLCESDSITKNELLDLLKRYAETISIYDQMMTTARLRKDGEFITSNYRDKYLKIYIENFIMRIKEVLMKTVCDNDEIDIKSLKESFPQLQRCFEKEGAKDFNAEEDKFPLMQAIISLYTTFIVEESIHPVGSEFPGNLKIEKRNGKFLCPVKDYQKDNKNAVCKLCIAEQAPDK